MQTLFLRLVNVSIAAGWLVLAVLAFRFLFRKAPKALRCLAWGLVALRLLLPVALESPFGLAPRVGEIPEELILQVRSANAAAQVDTAAGTSAVQAPAAPEQDPAAPVSGIGQIIHFEASGSVSVALPGASAQTGTEEKTFTPAPGAAEPARNGSAAGADALRLAKAATGAAIVWAVGLAAMLVYALWSFVTLKRKTRLSVSPERGVILCDEVSTPFILGVLRPVIVLPSSISEEDARFALAHERAHIARRDHLVKPFGFLLLAVYWFNPLMWLAYGLLCRDIELACDERVIKNGGPELKKGYSTALINCGSLERRITGCPVAFGEIALKERVRAVLSYQKAGSRLAAAAVICCVLMGVFLLPSRSVAHAAEPQAAALPVPSEKGAEQTAAEPVFNRVFVYTPIMNENGQACMRVMLSEEGLRFCITRDSDGFLAEGTYTFSGDSLVLTAEDGGEYRFLNQLGKLVYSPGQGERLPGIPRGKTLSLERSVSSSDSYYCSGDSGYLYRPEDGTFYLFGDAEEVLPVLRQEPGLASEAMQAGLSALLKTKSPKGGAALFRWTVEGFVPDEETGTEACFVIGNSLLVSGGSDFSVVFSALSVPADSSGNSPGLTPGSKFARGGYPYGY